MTTVTISVDFVTYAPSEGLPEPLIAGKVYVNSDTQAAVYLNGDVVSIYTGPRPKPKP